MRAGLENLNRHAAFVPLLIFSSFLSSCAFKGGEVAEAQTLAGTLKKLAPQAREMLKKEHEAANGLKLMLEEAGGEAGTEDFRKKVTTFLDTLTTILNGRKLLQETVRQGVWQSPMVHRVQQDSIVQLQDEITRSETWIQYVENIRTRAAFRAVAAAQSGAKPVIKAPDANPVIPEYLDLKRELDAFLTATDEDPLGNQLRALEEEFRFGEAQVRP